MFTIEETFVCTLPGIARIKTFKGWSKLYASNFKKDSPTSFPASFFVCRHAVLEVRRFRCDVGLNDIACIICTKMSFGLCRGCCSLLCAIRQYRIRLFVLFPPMKWIKNISCSLAVWHGKGSVSYFFRVLALLNTRSFSGSVDAVVVDADWTLVASGACWNQSNGLTFTFFLGGMSACFRWVMGESASTHDPSTHCLLWL